MVVDLVLDGTHQLSTTEVQLLHHGGAQFGDVLLAFSLVTQLLVVAPGREQPDDQADGGPDGGAGPGTMMCHRPPAPAAAIPPVQICRIVLKWVRTCSGFGGGCTGSASAVWPERRPR